jgi:hypothetical protein
MDEYKRAHMDVSSQLFQWHAAEGDDFLLDIVAGDESWFHCFDFKTKW